MDKCYLPSSECMSLNTQNQNTYIKEMTPLSNEANSCIVKLIFNNQIFDPVKHLTCETFYT